MSHNSETAELRPGAIILLEGLRKLGLTPILDTMCDDESTEIIFNRAPRLRSYFPKERRVTVSNRKRYDTSHMANTELRPIYEDLNRNMAGGKNPTEYGANLLIDDTRSPVSDKLGFRVIQVPSPDEDRSGKWAHKVLEEIAKIGK